MPENDQKAATPGAAIQPTAPTAPATVAAPKVTLDSLMASTAAPAPVAPGAVSEALATDAAATQRALTALSPEDQRRADELAARIDFNSRDFEMTYGADAQRDMASFSDSVLERTANRDTGEAGKLITDLLGTIDDSALSGVKKLPIVGQVVMKIDAIRREYQKVAPQVDEIVAKLDRARAQMVSDITMFDNMYDRTVAQYRTIKVYVAAGRKALSDFRAQQLPGLESQAAASGDPMQAQTLKDFKDRLEMFDKRLDDLDRLGTVALQAAPQVRIIQNADKLVVDKINTTVSMTIPMWKSQLVIALGLENQRRALELQNAVDDTTNRLMRENAERLHQGAVDAAKASQRGVVDIDTLQKVNAETIAALKETAQIQREGRKSREQAQGQIVKMEGDLKQALLDAARGIDR